MRIDRSDLRFRVKFFYFSLKLIDVTPVVLFDLKMPGDLLMVHLGIFCFITPEMTDLHAGHNEEDQKGNGRKNVDQNEQPE